MGPWYEETGPDASYVRGEVLKRMISQFPTLSSSYIEKVILKHIPDALESAFVFGSWRGWATFGLDKIITNSIKSDLDDGMKAFNKLKELLSPCIRHHLYKPGGIRMLETSQTTMVGKSV
jgi:hypothetical protein